MQMSKMVSLTQLQSKLPADGALHPPDWGRVDAAAAAAFAIASATASFAAPPTQGGGGSGSSSGGDGGNAMATAIIVSADRDLKSVVRVDWRGLRRMYRN